MKHITILEQARDNIDKIDDKIVGLLAKRKECSITVGKFKKKNGLAIRQPSREKQILRQRMEQAKKLRINPKFIKTLFAIIFTDSRNIQKKG